MKRKVFTSFLLLLLLPISLIAQIPDNAVIQYSTICTIEKGKKIIEESYLIQVNNEQGEWITDIEIPYREENKVQMLAGEIRDSNGNVVRKLKKRDMVEVSHISSISLYEDNYIKKFSLKHNQYPYQIYYSYQMEYEEFMWVTSWSPVLNTKTPTQAAQLSLHVPVDFPISINENNISTYETDTLNGTITYQWHADYLTPVKTESYAPPLKEILPLVQIVPVHFNYGVEGNAATWQSYGNWLHRLSEGLTDLPVFEQGKVHHLVKGIEDPKEIVKVLYNYMQDNTRYINVTIDIGGMKPYPAEYVAINKYGDCKALTNYMKALLEIVKIPSYNVDVYAGANPGSIKADFPSQQFNHVILCVPLEHDTLWLETTSNIAPVGYLGVFTQNRKGLLFDQDRSRLINIPALTLEEVRETQAVVYHIDENEAIIADIKQVCRGPQFEFYNYILSQYSKNQQKQVLSQYLPYHNFEVLDWEIKKADRNRPEISVRLKLKLKKNLETYDTDLILKPHSLDIPQFESPEDRELPVNINYPINRTDSLTLRLPESFVHTKHSEDFAIDSKYGSYSVQLKQEERNVKIIRHFTLNRGDYAVEDYPEFYDFIKNVRLAESKNYINLLHKEL